ncbi:MAG: molybdopterin molybdotransferase MoeA [Acidobacteria bacterium]|nr:molybdopterin molybdotransferase MoeA [Acidobacteriota bacterium]MBS1867496.1 molybdopterin molybdotransferase MoeA [Acidobacteriota bacterium]
MRTFEEARRDITRELGLIAHPGALKYESVSLRNSLGRVLVNEIRADRLYPPFDRSLRDGYAVRASDVAPNAKLKLIGELKAGDTPQISVAPGTCVQIMTGAAVPQGADAVVMIEHTRSEADTIVFDRPALAGQHIVPRGREAAEGQVLLVRSARIGFAEIAVAAQVGAIDLQVYRKPRVAILSTGDEVVSAEEKPGDFQIRNSNAYSLAAQVTLRGGEPVVLVNAKDTEQDLHEKIARGLKEDMLVLSGGVSAGKYDLVEKVLRDLGAHFHFDAVAIRPGKPTVFAICNGKPVFGLPGNPISTMVTFELFASLALELLSGAQAKPLAFLDARLGESLQEKTGLAHFLPARLTWPDGTPTIAPLKWQGSGDLAAVAKANCFLYIPADRSKFECGETVSVLPRRDVL